MPPTDTIMGRLGSILGRKPQTAQDSRPQTEEPWTEEVEPGDSSVSVPLPGEDRLAWTKEAISLKEGATSIDFERTLEDMLDIIKQMESQLAHVLDINLLLERDLNQSKERIAELKAERDRLREILARKEEEMPTVHELQMVIDQFLEERNEAELRIRDQKRQNDQYADQLLRIQSKVSELESDRKGLITEVNLMESRLSAALDQKRQAEEKAKRLDAQSAADKDRIRELEHDLDVLLDEKFKLARELKDTQRP